MPKTCVTGFRVYLLLDTMHSNKYELYTRIAQMSLGSGHVVYLAKLH